MTSSDGVLQIHDETILKGAIVSNCIDILDELGAFPRDFEASSMQYLDNCTVDTHTDANTGLSLLVSFGNSQGGEFLHGSSVLNTFQEPRIIDGSIPHSVAAFTGDRKSIAFYPHNKMLELTPVAASFLRSLGFRLPASLDAFEAPRARKWSKEVRHFTTPGRTIKFADQSAKDEIRAATISSSSKLTP